MKSNTSAPDPNAPWTVLATLISLVATAGSLWLSMGMKLKACPLCFYQRSFAMAVAAMLLVGVAARISRVSLCLLALAPAVAGLGVAGFHVWLEFTGKLECPAGVFGLGTAPQQSAAAFALLVVMLFAGARFAGAAILGPLVLGAGMAWGSIASAPALPQTPAKAYEAPLDTCRPPFRP